MVAGGVSNREAGRKNGGGYMDNLSVVVKNTTGEMCESGF